LEILIFWFFFSIETHWIFIEQLLNEVMYETDQLSHYD
jgi:hypothetical protein